MICSVLIPSRFKFDRLVQCIESINKSAGGHDFEIVVRFHNDDKKSVNRIGELSRFVNVRMIFGETFQGYNSLNIFAEELEDAAQGDWHWHMNDDMTVMGEGWDEQLILMPANVLVQPEIHQLGDEIYYKDRCGPAPIYHKTSCKLFRPLGPGGPDVQIWDSLVNKNNFEVRFLNGIGVWHRWEPGGHSIYDRH